MMGVIISIVLIVVSDNSRFRGGSFKEPVAKVIEDMVGGNGDNMQVLEGLHAVAFIDNNVSAEFGAVVRAGDEPVDSLLEVHIRGQVQFHEVLEGVVDESRAVVKRVGEELHQLLHIVGLVASEFVSAADGVV